MSDSVFSRLKKAWNLFSNKNEFDYSYDEYGGATAYRPDRPIVYNSRDKTILTSIINRMAIDASQIGIRHVRTDKNGRYLEDVNSGLNNCLNLEANIDQSSRQFKTDLYMSLLDEGCIAIVPVDTSYDVTVSSSYDILTMRVGKITQWSPSYVTVHLYDERTGQYEDVHIPKSLCAIVENPFYAVMNDQNSTMKRLVRKLNLLDVIDEQSGAGKLDLIIQLPYTVRGELKRQQAEQRRKDIETQLKDSKYGVAYIDGTEHVVQLNRAVENNLLKQIEYLTSMLYSQLGISQEIMNGTADENVMNNYLSRTIEPLVNAPVEEFKRKFLTKTARSQGQTIMMFSDPFRLVPVTQIAEITDKLTRNAVLTSNEIRQIMGFKPSQDPDADVLRNKNLNENSDVAKVNIDGELVGNNSEEETERQNEV